jgi:hypothetical protein
MKLQDVLRKQGQQCDALGSPFMGRLLPLIADRIEAGTPVADKILNWQGDMRPQADSVPLRLAGALHALVLTDASVALKAAYPPNNAPDDTLWNAVEDAFTTHAEHILNWLQSPPQTNEVRRSSVIIPAAHIAAAKFGLPLRLSELGASGGLNLMFDTFGLEAGGTTFPGPSVTLSPDWNGLAPAAADLQISERRGVDLNPLNPHNPDDQLRLRAYLWADQPDRLARTNAAIEKYAATVDRGDVEPWLNDRLKTPKQGTTHFIFHTVAWQYFPEETKARCRKAIEKAGEKATTDAPLAWFSMEADDNLNQGAKLTLRLWPGNIPLDLGRADFHGRWVNWAGDPN